jgi:hypothetical protein
MRQSEADDSHPPRGADNDCPIILGGRHHVAAGPKCFIPGTSFSQMAAGKSSEVCGFAGKTSGRGEEVLLAGCPLACYTAWSLSPTLFPGFRSPWIKIPHLGWGQQVMEQIMWVGGKGVEGLCVLQYVLSVACEALSTAVGLDSSFTASPRILLWLMFLLKYCHLQLHIEPRASDTRVLIEGFFLFPHSGWCACCADDLRERSMQPKEVSVGTSWSEIRSN